MPIADNIIPLIKAEQKKLRIYKKYIYISNRTGISMEPWICSPGTQRFTKT